MLTSQSSLLQLVTYVAAAYYLLSPILILLITRLNVAPRFVPFDPRKESPSTEAASHFSAMQTALVQMGFRLVAGFVIHDFAPQVRTFAQVYVNESTQDSAMVSSVVRVGPGHELVVQAQYLEFVSHFHSGLLELIQTNNNDSAPSVFAEWPKERTVRISNVNDAARLYQIHQAAVCRFAPTEQKTNRLLDEYGGDVIRYFHEAVFREPLENQAKLGCLHLDKRHNCYRPTVKGAYLMAWKLLWPIKAIRVARARSLARRLESELGS